MAFTHGQPGLYGVCELLEAVLGYVDAVVVAMPVPVKAQLERGVVADRPMGQSIGLDQRHRWTNDLVVEEGQLLLRQFCLFLRYVEVGEQHPNLNAATSTEGTAVWNTMDGDGFVDALHTSVNRY